jgi:hypothetical protein
MDFKEDEERFIFIFIPLVFIPSSSVLARLGIIGFNPPPSRYFNSSRAIPELQSVIQSGRRHWNFLT